jgi:uncharacterized repeat protein (TIGR02543 family)
MVLTICVIAGTLAGFSTTSFAADAVSVTIESFIRGEQTDLRSSELLVAKVEGYNGNVYDLTYEWKSTLGTYLYVYNSHNMYSINNTDGEIEVHNTDKNIKPSANMAGRTYDGVFSGKGYAYSSVYGANLSASTSLDGVITVTVKDASGKVLATDSHTGKITEKSTGFWKNYTYSGIVNADLQADLDNVSFGLFEGDTRNVKDLLGESAILHITCEACSVTQGKIESGKNYITLTKDGDYFITGKAAGTATTGGDAKVTVTVEKDNCKFHNNSEGKATTTVYVYKKPIPVPTTTSITLAKESLDSRCRYFIDGVEATTQADGTVIFTGLTPNTDYQIEVVGVTHDTSPAYAYVYTKTLPVFNANVKVYLNGTYDSETGTVTSGTLVDLTDLGASDNDLFIKRIGTNVFVELVHTGTGSYSVGVENGVYEMFYEADVNALLPEQQLTIDGENRTRYMFYNSVEYDANGGVGAPATDYYYSGNPATVSDIVPTREGFLFKGWSDEDGNVYQANNLITEKISKAYKLTAKWEELKVESYVNNYAYIFGYTNTEMGAEGSLLRCEASAMVHRLVKQNGKLGDFVYDAANPSFNDIQGEWFQSGIEFLHHKGGFKVAEGGAVQPYVTITRGEAFKLVALGLGFTTDTTLSNAGYANLLRELGYIQGDENGDLNVDSMVSRAEFCTMYNRIIGREYALLVDNNGNNITADTYGFKDLEEGKWYYEVMLRATSAYDDNGFVDIAKRGIRNDLDDYTN